MLFGKRSKEIGEAFSSTNSHEAGHGQKCSDAPRLEHARTANFQLGKSIRSSSKDLTSRSGPEPRPFRGLVL
jgi:hypothetical protein